MSVPGAFFEVTGKFDELVKIEKAINDNDGRLTASSSASLDLWLDMKEEWFKLHCKEVEKRAAYLAEHPEGTPATLDGATSEPERGVQLATAGEFAARWNTWTPEHQQQAFENMQEAMRTRNRCFMEDHDGLKEQLEKAHTRIVELLTRPPLQYAVITDADLGRAAQTFYEEVGKTDGVQLVINMTDKALLVRILEKTLADLGFKRPLKRENFDVVYQHEDCEHCEAAVELAIAEIKERGIDHASWTVVSAPPDSQAPAEDHVGKASRN